MQSIKLSNGNEVKVSHGMRFADFLKHNNISDADTAQPIFTEARGLLASSLQDEIAKRQLGAVSSKEQIKHRGGVFYVQPTITYSEYQANEKHTQLVKDWAINKRKAGEAAMEKARIFAASLEKKSPPHTSNTSERKA